MGVLLDTTLRVRQTNQLKELNRTLPSLIALQPFVDLQGLNNLVAHPEDRIEAGCGLLKDHRDAIATNLTHLLTAQGAYISTIEENRSFDDTSRRILNQAQDRQRGDTLS